MKISCRLPAKSNIIIFGLDSESLVSIFNSNNIDYSIYDQKLILVNINLIFIYKFIINILKCYGSCGFLKLFYNVYHLTNLQIISPKSIFTQSDNDTLMHWLIKYKNTINFIAIQNGLRTKYELKYLKKEHIECYKHDILLMFGQNEEDFFNSMNVNINKSIKIGSLRLGLFLELKKTFNKKYDICLMSEVFRLPNQDSKFYKLQKELYNHVYEMNKAISFYAKETKKSIIVALRKSHIDEQKEYFRNIFGDNVIFTSNESKYSSYEATCMSEITLAFFSTVLLESLALGNKVLSIDTSNSNLYFNYPSFIKHNYDNHNDFKNHLDKILDMSDHEYKEKSKDILNYSMSMNINNLPHNQILKFTREF